MAALLGSAVWTGGGPGMMRAASEGGLKAGVPVGGIRISREAGTNVLTMEDYLSAGSAFTCKYMPTRKVGARTGVGGVGVRCAVWGVGESWPRPGQGLDAVLLPQPWHRAESGGPGLGIPDTSCCVRVRTRDVPD